MLSLESIICGWILNLALSVGSCYTDELKCITETKCKMKFNNNMYAHVILAGGLVLLKKYFVWLQNFTSEDLKGFASNEYFNMTSYLEMGECY